LGEYLAALPPSPWLFPSISAKSGHLRDIKTPYHRVVKAAGWRFFADANGTANIRLEAGVTFTKDGNLHYFWDLDRGNPYVITSFPRPVSP